MQTIQFLVLATAIAALIAGLNVSQVAHAQSQGTCAVGSNTATPVTNPTSNPTSGNPHCFDPEQQPASATPPAGSPLCSATSGCPTGCAGSGPTAACSGGPAGNHPQSINPQGKVVGNPHEEPVGRLGLGSGCSAGQAGPCSQNPAGDIVGDPHSMTR
jgi:hypothetical protein